MTCEFWANVCASKTDLVGCDGTPERVCRHLPTHLDMKKHIFCGQCTVLYKIVHVYGPVANAPLLSVCCNVKLRF